MCGQFYDTYYERKPPYAYNNSYEATLEIKYGEIISNKLYFIFQRKWSYDLGRPVYIELFLIYYPEKGKKIAILIYYTLNTCENAKILEDEHLEIGSLVCVYARITKLQRNLL